MVWFAHDSALEGDGFELSVPRVMGGRFRTTGTSGDRGFRGSFCDALFLRRCELARHCAWRHRHVHRIGRPGEFNSFRRRSTGAPRGSRFNLRQMSLSFLETIF